MAHNSTPRQQPPFEIVLDDSCSIVCDEVPLNCTIRLLPVDGRSPPRISPVSQWAGEDYAPGGHSGGQDWTPQRDRFGKVVGSPITSPPPPTPMRSRRSIMESVRRNNQENTGATSSATGTGGIHKGFEAAEYEVFAFRKAYSKHGSHSPSPTPSFTSASSYTTAISRPPSPSSAEQSDRLMNSNRPQMDFKRTNIHVDGTDLREMHSNVGSPPSTPAGEPWASASSSPPSPRPSPPSPARGGRCCGMADYNPAAYRSQTPERGGPSATPPERDFGGAAVSTVGGTCTYHATLPCPARAASRCRENRPGPGKDRARSPAPFQGVIACSYHNELPCPLLAGVPCRGERGKSGTPTPSPSRSPSPALRPPRVPSPDVRPGGGFPEPYLRSSGAGSPGRSGGVAYPPSTISPPPRNSRSRTPSRRPPQKCKGTCL